MKTFRSIFFLPLLTICLFSAAVISGCGTIAPQGGTRMSGSWTILHNGTQLWTKPGPVVKEGCVFFTDKDGLETVVSGNWHMWRTGP